MPLQDIFEESGDIQELIAMGEAKAYARGYTKEEAQAYARYYAKQYTKGRLEVVRRMLPRVLQARFPDIDVSWIDLSSIEYPKLLETLIVKASIAQDPGEVFVALGRALHDQKASLAKEHDHT